MIPIRCQWHLLRDKQFYLRLIHVQVQRCAEEILATLYQRGAARRLGKTSNGF